MKDHIEMKPKDHYSNINFPFISNNDVEEALKRMRNRRRNMNMINNQEEKISNDLYNQYIYERNIINNTSEEIYNKS